MFAAPTFGARGPLAARVLPQPLAPCGPPTSRHALRRFEPTLRIGPRLAVHPVVAFLLRRWIDHSGNVPAGTEHEPVVAGQTLPPLVRRVPRHDVEARSRAGSQVP